MVKNIHGNKAFNKSIGKSMIQNQILYWKNQLTTLRDAKVYIKQAQYNREKMMINYQIRQWQALFDYFCKCTPPQSDDSE
jgi:hypothetical protein